MTRAERVTVGLAQVGITVAHSSNTVFLSVFDPVIIDSARFC